MFQPRTVPEIPFWHSCLQVKTYQPRIRAHYTHDLVAAFTTPGGKLTLDAALLNVADREPPRVYRQINYDPVTHNPLGRVFQVGVRWRL